MELRLPVTVHMCRQATESPSHFLRKSHMVSHVGQQTVLRCFGEIFPSILHVALGTCVSELCKESKSKSQQDTRSSIQVFSLLTYEWHVKVKCRSCNDSRIHKRRKTYQILQVDDKIMTGASRSKLVSRTFNHISVVWVFFSEVRKCGSKKINKKWNIRDWGACMS